MAVVGATAGESIVSVNPARWDDLVHEVETVDSLGVQDCARRLRAAPPREPSEKRARSLWYLAEVLRAEGPDLSLLIVREVGKLPDEAASEVEFAARIAEHYAGLLEAGRSVDASIREQGVGLAAVVTPFNFPCSISVMKVGAAYGGGAPVLWKPSPHGIGVAARLQAIFADCLGPIVAAISTADEEAFGEIARQSDALSFTGGSGGAGILWRSVSARPKAMQLELGSCNATIIGSRYPLELAVPILRASVFSYSGQKCSSTRRIVAPRRLIADVFDAMSDSLRADRVGDPQEAGTTIPPLVAPPNADRYRSDMDAWRSVTVARTTLPIPDDATDCFVEPTVALAEQDGEPLRQEVFGPAAVLIPYDDFSEALSISNETPFALFAGLLSGDEHEIAEFKAEARAGILKVNQTTPGLSPGLPSQGWDASGIGPSELGMDPFRPFLRTQTVYPYEVPAP